MIGIVHRAFLALASAMMAIALPAQPLDKIVFATDWLAQAEHGGFYQAVAEGLYKKHGLDVTIRMGGPQVNGLQLLAAGQLDVVMGDALQVLSAVEQGVPVTAIAATFQKNPTVIIAHPDVLKLEELKGKPIAVSAASNTTFWPWFKQRYGFTDNQKRPYAFSVQPFLADKNLSQQGFATSEPFTIEQGRREAGGVPAGRARISAVLRSARRAPRHAHGQGGRADAVRARIRGGVEELPRESRAGQRAHQARQSADGRTSSSPMVIAG